MNPRNGMRPVHPGEILREELDTLGLSANELSKELGVSATRITMVLNGHWDVSADTALRLASLFWDNSATVAESAKDMGA